MGNLSPLSAKAISIILVLIVVTELLIISLLGIPVPGINGFYIYLGALGVGSIGVVLVWFRCWRSTTSRYWPAVLVTLGLVLVFLSIPMGSRVCLAGGGGEAPDLGVAWSWDAVSMFDIWLPAIGVFAGDCVSWLNTLILVGGYICLSLGTLKEKSLEKGIIRMGQILRHLMAS